ncbi:hypothetical protein PybrP1_011941 [[Pythium] brassicae (nom. inval.)]|nr:hypothetical protein PybrP1_011941 [[Pythium] brassicae (nom. inval.)]
MKGIPSFDTGEGGKCVAPENAACRVLPGTGTIGVVAVVAVVSLLRRKHESPIRGDLKQVVITPENMPTATPKLSTTVFVYTAQI